MGLRVFGHALAAYGLSFMLFAASTGDGFAVPGFACAYLVLARPLIDKGFFESKMVESIPVLIAGWINVVFLLSLTIAWRFGKVTAFRILRTVTLLMIPFSWIVFYEGRVYPREGHVLWVAGMVLALFSEIPSSSRLLTPDMEA